jgi:hypothetical protein
MIQVEDRKLQTGLSKLVLINSGVSEYVEIETDRVTHLAGENGLGKTSILATLQFLMIDNWDNMKFLMDRPDTEEHYFPDEYSSIIFEIKTQDKSSHMIVFRGNNIADDKRYSRFYVDGMYDKSLFIDSDDFPMDWENVFVNMAGQGREVMPLKGPVDLRSKLRSLQWLPTKDKENIHSDFVTLLKTLNTLGKVNQNDLKQVLMNINSGIQTRIDFNVEFGDSWHRHVKRRKLVSTFDNDIKKITEMNELNDSIQLSMKNVQDLCDKCGPSVAFYNSDFQSIKSKKKEEISKIEGDKTRLVNEEKSLQQTFTEYNNNLTTIKVRISDARKEEVWTAEQNFPVLENRAENALRDYTDLSNAFKKYGSVNLSVNQINSEMKRIEQEITNDRRQLEAKSSTLLFDVISKGFGDNALTLSYLSTNLLKSEGKIKNQDLFSDFVSKIESSRTAADKMEINGLEIEDINQFISTIDEDPTILEAKINDKEIKLRELEDFILIATEKEEQEKTLIEKKRIMQESQNNLTRFNNWNLQGKEEYKNNISQKQKIETNVSETREKLDLERAKIKQIDSDLRKKSQEIEDLQSGIGYLNQYWKGIIDELEGGFAYNQEEQIPMNDLSIELQKGEEIVKKIRKDSKNFSHLQDNLIPKFSDLLPYTSKGEFIEQMVDLYSTIEEEREKIQKEWNHLFDNISRSANLMRNGIKTLRQEVNGINNIFKKIQVSNLDGFFVEFKMNSKNLEYFAELNSFSKHLTDMATIQSMEQVGKDLINRRSINLADEFRLEFHVQFKGTKKPKIVKNLDQGGSTGTRVLIKAVLLMILLYKRIQSKSQRVPMPFFLDELGVFGANNKGQIVEVARQLDFQIFTASPDSMEDADLVYPILGGRENDRIVVVPNMAVSQTYSIDEEE